MSRPEDNSEVARLERLNDELTDSLERCQNLLHDYEVRLTANSNHSDEAAHSEETRKA